MEITLFIAALATIIAGVYGTIQLFEWWQKHKKMQKKKKVIGINDQPLVDVKETIKIINFTHPLTDKIIHQVENAVNKKVEDVIEIKTHLEEYDTFDKQVEGLVNKVGFTSEEWQTGTFIIHLPGFSQAAAILLAELHGRMGHFPSILRLKAIENSAPREFELAELVNLQNIRDAARENL